MESNFHNTLYKWNEKLNTLQPQEMVQEFLDIVDTPQFRPPPQGHDLFTRMYAAQASVVFDRITDTSGLSDWNVCRLIQGLTSGQITAIALELLGLEPHLGTILSIQEAEKVQQWLRKRPELLTLSLKVSDSVAIPIVDLINSPIANLFVQVFLEAQLQITDDFDSTLEHRWQNYPSGTLNTLVQMLKDPYALPETTPLSHLVMLSCANTSAKQFCRTLLTNRLNQMAPETPKNLWMACRCCLSSLPNIHFDGEPSTLANAMHTLQQAIPQIEDPLIVRLFAITSLAFATELFKHPKANPDNRWFAEYITDVMTITAKSEWTPQEITDCLAGIANKMPGLPRSASTADLEAFFAWLENYCNFLDPKIEIPQVEFQVGNDIRLISKLRVLAASHILRTTLHSGYSESIGAPLSLAADEYQQASTIREYLATGTLNLDLKACALNEITGILDVAKRCELWGLIDLLDRKMAEAIVKADANRFSELASLFFYTSEFVPQLPNATKSVIDKAILFAKESSVATTFLNEDRRPIVAISDVNEEGKDLVLLLLNQLREVLIQDLEKVAALAEADIQAESVYFKYSPLIQWSEICWKLIERLLSHATACSLWPERNEIIIKIQRNPNTNIQENYGKPFLEALKSALPRLIVDTPRYVETSLSKDGSFTVALSVNSNSQLCNLLPVIDCLGRNCKIDLLLDGRRQGSHFGWKHFSGIMNVNLYTGEITFTALGKGLNKVSIALEGNPDNTVIPIRRNDLINILKDVWRHFPPNLETLEVSHGIESPIPETLTFEHFSPPADIALRHLIIHNSSTFAVCYPVHLSSHSSLQSLVLLPSVDSTYKECLADGYFSHLSDLSLGYDAFANANDLKQLEGRRVQRISIHNLQHLLSDTVEEQQRLQQILAEVRSINSSQLHYDDHGTEHFKYQLDEDEIRQVFEMYPTVETIWCKTDSFDRYRDRNDDDFIGFPENEKRIGVRFWRPKSEEGALKNASETFAEWIDWQTKETVRIRKCIDEWHAADNEEPMSKQRRIEEA